MLTSVKQPENSLKVLTFDPMLEKKYKNIIYFITLAIIATIAAQVYWNIKNYEVNKQHFTNQIQSSFDSAVEKYFAGIAKKDVSNFIKPDTSSTKKVEISISNHNYTNQVWVQSIGDSIPTKSKKKLLQPTLRHSGSIILKELDSISDINQISIFKNKIDSLDLSQFTSKILFSFIMNDVKLEEIDSLFRLELQRKNITLQHGFRLIDKSPLSQKESVKTYNLEGFSNDFQSAISNSPFVNTHSTLELRYTNTTTSILKRMLESILLSLLLSGIIIGCLLFLLKIIFNQKQLSEVKNDLISNITHEFKTPISTISLALEGLENSDIVKDETKKKQYLSMSKDQLNKLNQMVEKLLETATLKADQFELDKEQINLSELIKNSVKKYQFSNPNKSISLTVDSNLNFQADALHFENAFNNIIDNAIKYGGNSIKINTQSTKGNIELLIEDNGDGFENQYKQKIFDQFYRIPTGNIHNVKGFGIGLYYTKNIIEKHGGKIIVSENKKGKVIFKITLPNGN